MEELNAFVPSQGTSQLLAPRTGTMYDSLIQYGQGLSRARAEKQKQAEQVQKESATLALEQKRYDGEVAAAQAELERKRKDWDSGTVIDTPEGQKLLRTNALGEKKIEVVARRDPSKVARELAKRTGSGKGSKPSLVTKDLRSSITTIGSSKYPDLFSTDADGNITSDSEGKKFVEDVSLRVRKLMDNPQNPMSQSDAIAQVMADVEVGYSPSVDEPFWSTSFDRPASYTPSQVKDPLIGKTVTKFPDGVREMKDGRFATIKGGKIISVE